MLKLILIVSFLIALVSINCFGSDTLFTEPRFHSDVWFPKPIIDYSVEISLGGGEGSLSHKIYTLLHSSRAYNFSMTSRARCYFATYGDYRGGPANSAYGDVKRTLFLPEKPELISWQNPSEPPMYFVSFFGVAKKVSLRKGITGADFYRNYQSGNFGNGEPKYARLVSKDIKRNLTQQNTLDIKGRAAQSLQKLFSEEPDERVQCENKTCKIHFDNTQ